MESAIYLELVKHGKTLSTRSIYTIAHSLPLTLLKSMWIAQPSPAVQTLILPVGA
jgi:hypothetical protein